MALMIRTNMSRSLERSYYSRWSEPSLRRHHPVHFLPTSEEDNSSIRRSRSISPELNLNNKSGKPANNCCICYDEFKKKKKSSKSKIFENKTENQRLRESLALQLVGTQVEEALASDKQAELIRHLDLATSTQEALIQHIESLQVSHFSGRRLLDLANQLIIPSSTNVESTSDLINDLTSRLNQANFQRDKRSKQLQEILEICLGNLKITARLQNLIDEHRMRRYDFSVAIKNFKDLLNNSKLNISQMEKLNRQYDRILTDYQKSRYNLDLELPKMVKMRLSTLRQGFQLINQYYNDIDHMKYIGSVFKVIGENIFQKDSTEVPEELMLKVDVGQLEICQKCKVNRVDKK